MTIASQSYDGSVAKQKEALANYLAKRSDGLKTVIASVHVSSAEIFTTTCKEETCTMKEMENKATAFLFFNIDFTPAE
ncbi:hypothetical protein TKWG_21495 [Advenella kashmirensis WT001]|uniref:Uncharacterized protein n=1 Tax=Advenella kashmirensis (strain DSM 17095 / LMG 22695 / WT001) TaxID=1036672 RepID=I3UG50_ADVKW|nr:hypothetical protein [Advenella kashmirensis]AFK63988.1 hypothetical protein TKWG_21495 [Advenella kashmirensis WT001]